MAQNFIENSREQGFLLPPDVRDWLADHLAWFVIDAAAGMDLGAFYGTYRADGHGASAYEPSMMVSLLLYADATKQRSSRMIERHCRQDVAAAELEQAGVSGRPRIALADSQYWNEEHIDDVVANRHVQVLIPPESRLREEPRPGWTGGRYDWMRAGLKGEVGQ